jgi:hypothetical protein
MNQCFTQKLLLMIALAGSSFGGAKLYGQQMSATPPKPYEGQVNYQKAKPSVVFVDVPYPTDVVEGVIKDYMAQHGWKGSGSHGYKLYHNVRLEDTASSLNDLHIKVDHKNSKDKMNSVVTFLPVMPGEDPGTKVGRDALAVSRTTAFIEKMIPAIRAGALEDDIKTQEGVTKKAQTKLGDLHDDQSDLEKKIRNTQDDLAKNKENRAKEAKDLQANVSDENAVKKINKRMTKLLDEDTDLNKKLLKYQSALEQNKKDQDSQRVVADREQQSLDSLRTLRKQ